MAGNMYWCPRGDSRRCSNGHADCAHFYLALQTDATQEWCTHLGCWYEGFSGRDWMCPFWHYIFVQRSKVLQKEMNSVNAVRYYNGDKSVLTYRLTKKWLTTICSPKGGGVVRYITERKVSKGLPLLFAASGTSSSRKSLNLFNGNKYHLSIGLLGTEIKITWMPKEEKYKSCCKVPKFQIDVIHINFVIWLEGYYFDYPQMRSFFQHVDY